MIRAAVGLGALVLACAGCARRELATAPPPAFAAALPGRTAVAAWSPSGVGVPSVVADPLRQLTAALQLEAVATEGSSELAFTTPAAIEVGWRSLGDSRLLGMAMAALADDLAGADAVVFLDLQQLAEAVQLRLSGGGPAAWSTRRTVRALGIRGLDFAALALRRDAAGWSGTGVVATSGSDRGVPGALTRETPAEPGPARQKGARLQVELLCADEVLWRAARVLTSSQGTPLFDAMGAPLGFVNEIARHLSGRLSVATSGTGSPRLAARVRDEVQLQRVLAEMPLPFDGGGTRRPGGLPGVEIDDGWLLAGPGADVPVEAAARPGPWLSVWLSWPLSGDVQGRLELATERLGPRRAGLRLRLEQP